VWVCVKVYEIMDARGKKGGVKTNLKQSAVYSTFPDCTSIFFHCLWKTHSHIHQELSIIPRAKYDHFALKDYESSKSTKVF
jgi:hypothetical protein